MQAVMSRLASVIPFRTKVESLLTFAEAQEVLGERNVYGIEESKATFGTSRVARGVVTPTPFTERQLSRIRDVTRGGAKLFLRYASLGQIRRACLDRLTMDQSVVDRYFAHFGDVKFPTYRLVTEPLNSGEEANVRRAARAVGMRVRPASLTTTLTIAMLEHAQGKPPLCTIAAGEPTRTHQIILLSDSAHGRVRACFAQNHVPWRRIFELRVAEKR